MSSDYPELDALNTIDSVIEASDDSDRYVVDYARTAVVRPDEHDTPLSVPASGFGDHSVGDPLPVDFEKGMVSYSPIPEVSEAGGEFIRTTLLSQFWQDTAELALCGDEAADTGDTSLDEFYRQNDGFLTQLEGTGAHTVGSDGSSRVFSDGIFDDLAEAATKSSVGYDSLSGEWMFFTPPEFRPTPDKLDSAPGTYATVTAPTGKQYTIETAVSSLLPDHTILLTHPRNLIHVLYERLRTEVLEAEGIVSGSSTQVQLRVHDDFLVESPEAAVLATNVTAPDSEAIPETPTPDP